MNRRFFDRYCDPLQLIFCREQGFRRNLLRDRFSSLHTLYSFDLKGHFGCVNAIEFSQHDGGQWIVSGGDDKRVLLWNVEKSVDRFGNPWSFHENQKSEKRRVDANPFIMKGEHHSNIFCLSFDNSGRKLFSGGNDEQVIVHDTETGDTTNVFIHDDAVYSISVDPYNDSVFASSSDNGKVLIIDTRTASSEDPFCLVNYQFPMHAVMYNPTDPRLLATANSHEGIGLWDIRKPKVCLLRYGGQMFKQSCMSVRFNMAGDKLIALRRRLPPVLYNIQDSRTVCMFDNIGYYNSCTMKSCCFAGDQDQYIISGSDDFNLYVWKLPKSTEEHGQWVGDAHMILKGHRSIVNQVRFNPSNHLVISSGVEKMIKLWSPFPFHEKNCKLKGTATDRRMYTHEDYIHLVIQSGQMMSHDYSHQSTEEDSRMIAFFDSLVQRELEGWSSEGSSTSPTPDRHGARFAVSSDSSSSSSESSSESDNEVAVIARFIPQSDEESNGVYAYHILDLDNNAEIDVPPPSALQHGDQSSESEDNSEQEQGPSRHVSISELIKNRRNHYLAGIRRFERRAQKMQKNMHLLRRAKMRRILRRANLESTSSSTSSTSSLDDSDTSGNITEIVTMGHESYEENSTGVSQPEVESIVVRRDNMITALQRLRCLRSQVEHEDTLPCEEEDLNKASPETSKQCGHTTQCECNTLDAVPSCSKSHPKQGHISDEPSCSNTPKVGTASSGHSSSNTCKPEDAACGTMSVVEQNSGIYCGQLHSVHTNPPTPPVLDTLDYCPSNATGESSLNVQPSQTENSSFIRRKKIVAKKHYRSRDGE